MALRTSTRLLIAASVPGGPGDHRQLLLRSVWNVKETMGRDYSSELLERDGTSEISDPSSSLTGGVNREVHHLAELQGERID